MSKEQLLVGCNKTVGQTGGQEESAVGYTKPVNGHFAGIGPKPNGSRDRYKLCAVCAVGASGIPGFSVPLNGWNVETQIGYTR
jgi:hypothetical protein